MCLTFDDGPHPVATPAVLEILRSHNIKATFFLLGQNAVRHPHIVEEIVKEGHVVGNHTQTHRRVWFERQDVLKEEVNACQRAVHAAAGVEPSVFRPPYGVFGPTTARTVSRLGLRTVLFSVNSWDFSDRSNDRIVKRATRGVVPGDIIVLHDNDSTAGRIQDYLPKIISTLQAQGISFGTP